MSKIPKEHSKLVKKLRSHKKFAKKNGWCRQCQEPWDDGLCECKDHNKERDIKCDNILDIIASYPQPNLTDFYKYINKV